MFIEENKNKKCLKTHFTRFGNMDNLKLSKINPSEGCPLGGLTCRTDSFFFYKCENSACLLMRLLNAQNKVWFENLNCDFELRTLSQPLCISRTDFSFPFWYFYRHLVCFNTIEKAYFITSNVMNLLCLYVATSDLFFNYVYDDIQLISLIINDRIHTWSYKNINKSNAEW